MNSLINALILLSSTLTATYPVVPPKTPQEVISGRSWAYTVPFRIQNKTDIERLIQCESGGVNISRPDSNGRESDGVLQYNRDTSNVLGSGTWSDMEKRFGFYGSPIMPSDAIHMADLMISDGYEGRWTCAHILGLVGR